MELSLPLVLNVKDSSGNLSSFLDKYACYSLRIDVKSFIINPSKQIHSKEDKTTKLNLYDYIRSFARYYVFGREISPTGKKHLQGFIMLREPLTEKGMHNIRLFLKRTYSDTTRTQPVSFRKSIKPKSLIKYCKKDNDYDTNIPPEMLEAIGEWVDRKDPRNKREELKWICENNKYTPEIIQECVKRCKNGTWKTMPTRQQLFHNLLMTGKITQKQYSNEFYNLDYYVNY